ncbi:MAG: DUF1932 domain-containing protein [Paracoccus sp.]|nr:DUF1932 domain-containing protein [Paracoccus sp. (in: a-proteobacteria)]
MSAEIAFIGFGEAGRAVAKGWRDEGFAGAIAAWDTKLDGAQAQPLRDAATDLDVACGPAPVVLARARHVLCLVTADQAVEAARQAAPHLAAASVWYDGNSCAPDSKREAATMIGDAGATYVDMAIMAPIRPRLHRTPLLIAGAETALDFLDRMNMQYRWRGPRIGSASAIKMIRSVMIKGMEALAAECLLSARRAGVLQDVLDSLQASDPATDWAAKAAYNTERMMQHGLRRAAEMREVAKTVEGLGLPADLARATVAWQQRIGDLGLHEREGDLMQRLAMIEEALCLSATSAT